MKYLLLVLCTMLTVPAMADGLIRGDFGYVSTSDKSGTTDTASSRQFIEFAGGYVWSSGFALLAQYAMETDTSSSGGTTTTSNRTSYGPGLGWISRGSVGVYVDGFYYLSSKLTTGSSTETGTGYQVDLGVKIDLSKIFLLVGMSYESFTYTSNNAGTLNPSDNVTNIDPRVGLQFEF